MATMAAAAAAAFPIDLEVVFAAALREDASPYAEPLTEDEKDEREEEAARQASNLFLFLSDLASSSVFNVLAAASAWRKAAKAAEFPAAEAQRVVSAHGASLAKLGAPPVSTPPTAEEARALEDWALRQLRTDLLPKLAAFHGIHTRVAVSTVGTGAGADGEEEEEQQQQREQQQQEEKEEVALQVVDWAKLSDAQLGHVTALATRLQEAPNARLVDFFQNIIDLNELTFGSDEQFQFAGMLADRFLKPGAVHELGGFPAPVVAEIDAALGRERVKLTAFARVQRLALSLLERQAVNPLLEELGLPPLSAELDAIVANEVHSSLLLSFAHSIHCPEPLLCLFEVDKYLEAADGDDSGARSRALFRVWNQHLRPEVEGRITLPQRALETLARLDAAPEAETRTLLKWVRRACLAITDAELMPAFRQHHFYSMTRAADQDEDGDGDARARRLSAMTATSRITGYDYEDSARSSIFSYYSGRSSLSSYYDGDDVLSPRLGAQGSRRSSLLSYYSTGSATDDAALTPTASPPTLYRPRGSLLVTLTGNKRVPTPVAAAASASSPPQSAGSGGGTPVHMTDATFDFDAAVSQRFRSNTAPGGRTRRSLVRKSPKPRARRSVLELEAVREKLTDDHAQRVVLFRQLEPLYRPQGPGSRRASAIDPADIARRRAEQVEHLKVALPEFVRNVRRRTVTEEEEEGDAEDRAMVEALAAAAAAKTTTRRKAQPPPPAHSREEEEEKTAKQQKKRIKKKKKEKTTRVRFGDASELGAADGEAWGDEEEEEDEEEDEKTRKTARKEGGILKKRSVREETLEEALYRIFTEREEEARQLLELMVQGATLKKYNAMHTSNKRWFQVSEDGTELTWESNVLAGSRDKNGWLRSLVRRSSRKTRLLAECVEIRYGTWWSRRFQRYNMRNKPPWLGFTLFFPDRTLDIVCANDREVTAWFLGLQSLVPLTGNYLSRGRLLWQRAKMKVEYQADALGITEDKLWHEMIADAQQAIAKQRERDDLGRSGSFTTVARRPPAPAPPNE